MLDKERMEQELAVFRDFIKLNRDLFEDEDCFPLSLGFFAGRGLPVKHAEILALSARYDHHYWEKEVMDWGEGVI